MLHLERANEEILAALGYKPIKRTFKDVAALLTSEQNRLSPSYDPDEAPYLIYASTLHPKLPNITYLPNLATSSGEIMLATTLGHQHTQKQKGDSRPFQELYEFHNYGAMLLRNTQGTRLHLLKPRDKITIGTDDNMTFINLSESPLITLDMSNPNMNSANKELESRIGTMILATFYNGTFRLEINPAYYYEGLLRTPVPKAPIEVKECKLGESLYEKLPNHKNEFKSAGIELVVGGNLTHKQERKFTDPLLTLVLKKDMALLESLGFLDVLNYPDM